MKKILHIFGILNNGGAELRTLELMEKFDKTFEFHICVLSGEKGKLDDEVEKMGIRIHYLNIKKIGFYKKFQKLLLNENYDIIHSHVLYMSGYINWLAYRNNIKSRISHFRTAKDIKESKSTLRKIRNKFLSYLIEKYSTNILYVSEVSKKQIIRRKKYPDKHEVIYNGFTNKNNFINKNKGSFVNVGRFNEYKNQIFVLEVIKCLKERYKIEIVVDFIGKYDTPYGLAFINKVKMNKLENNVNLLGEIKNASKEMEKYEFFLFPTKLEGLPGVLIEAHINHCYTINSNIKENIEVNQYFKQESSNLELDVEIWSKYIYEFLINKKKTIQIKKDHPFLIDNSYMKIKKIYSKL